MYYFLQYVFDCLHFKAQTFLTLKIVLEAIYDKHFYLKL